MINSKVRCGDCDVTLLRDEDEASEILSSMFPGQVVPKIDARFGEDSVAACIFEGAIVAVGAIDRSGKIRVWLKDAAVADSPVIDNLQGALEYFHSMRAGA